MNFQDMVANMTPQMLSQGLKRISASLTPEQIKQMEQAIKSVDKGELNKQLNSLSAQDLQNELSRNPALVKQLAKNPQLSGQLQEIFKKK